MEALPDHSAGEREGISGMAAIKRVTLHRKQGTVRLRRANHIQELGCAIRIVDAHVEAVTTVVGVVHRYRIIQGCVGHIDADTGGIFPPEGMTAGIEPLHHFAATDRGEYTAESLGQTLGIGNLGDRPAIASIDHLGLPADTVLRRVQESFCHHGDPVGTATIRVTHGNTDIITFLKNIHFVPGIARIQQKRALMMCIPKIQEK